MVPGALVRAALVMSVSRPVSRIEPLECSLLLKIVVQCNTECSAESPALLDLLLHPL